MKCGTWISKRPNIERARARMTAAIARMTTGFWSQTPKSEPERAAKTPSAEYVTLIPRTYAAASPNVLAPCPPLCRPKYPSVIGIRGYTQGVRLRASPDTKTRPRRRGRDLPPKGSSETAAGRAFATVAARRPRPARRGAPGSLTAFRSPEPAIPAGPR